ncbi:MAG: hypothetical protein HC938_09785 [Nitrospira sp.]|nr:hypothetical protein [Nitrospira sp.]
MSWPVATARCGKSADRWNRRLSFRLSAGEKHTDHTYGFTVKYYSSEYVLLTDDPHQATTQPPAVQRVYFQRKDLVAGQVVDHEPPGLTISVFERSPSLSLREWLDSSGLLPPGSEISSVRLTGVKEGLRVTLRQQPAPNEFVYLANDQYVYGLVSYGAGRENAAIIPPAPGFLKGSYETLI